MENASKALIIAGAILLSILIIALGVFIFNQAKSATDTSALTSTEISTFNAKYEDYEGSAILGNSVKTLLSNLIANAATNEGAGDKLPTVVYYANGASSPTNNAQGQDYAANDSSTYLTTLRGIRTNIANNHNYQVEMSDYNDGGYVSVIKIRYTPE